MISRANNLRSLVTSKLFIQAFVLPAPAEAFNIFMLHVFFPICFPSCGSLPLPPLTPSHLLHIYLLLTTVWKTFYHLKTGIIFYTFIHSWHSEQKLWSSKSLLNGIECACRLKVYVFDKLMNPFLLLLKFLKHWILPFGLVCIQFGAHQQITDDSTVNYVMSYVSFCKYEQFINEILKDILSLEWRWR